MVLRLGILILAAMPGVLTGRTRNTRIWRLYRRGMVEGAQSADLEVQAAYDIKNVVLR